MKACSKIGTLITAAAMLLCGCSKGGSEEKANNYQTKADFQIAEGFSLPENTDMGIYSFTQYGGGMGRIDALSMLFFSEEERQYAKREEHNDYSEQGISPYAELKYESKELHLSGNGYFYYFDEREEPEGAEYFNGEPIFERDFADTEIALKDGAVKLDELCTTAQSYLTDCFAALGVSLEARPIYAIRHKADSEFAEMFFGLDLGGGATVKLSEYSLDDPQNEISLQFRVCMARADKPFEVQSMFELFTPQKCDNKSHIDCDEAIVSASNAMLAAAPHMKLLYASLEYIPKVESYDRTLWGEEFDHQYGAVYKAEPAWALYFQKEDGSYQLTYVNALSGKLETAGRAPF